MKKHLIQKTWRREALLWFVVSEGSLHGQLASLFLGCGKISHLSRWVWRSKVTGCMVSKKQRREGKELKTRFTFNDMTVQEIYSFLLTRYYF